MPINHAGQTYKSPKAGLLFTGTELLRGKANTYMPIFAAELGKLGFDIRLEATAADNEKAIAQAARLLLSQCELVISVGGLGPTFDDLTREGAAKALNRRLKLSQKAAAALRRRFLKYKKPMPPSNLRQAEILDGAVIMPNAAGTAPGQLIVLGPAKSRKLAALLPGPLNEWEPMFFKYVIPAIKKTFPQAARDLACEMRLADIPEAAAGEALAPVLARHKTAEFTILSSPGDVRFIARVRGQNLKQAAAELEAIKTACREAVGAKIYCEQAKALEEVLGELLIEKGWSLAAAESCTGGLISHRLTDVPGSSAYYKGTAVVYSNEAKQKLLGVKTPTLKNYGAVSRPCALEMAAGAKKLFDADCAVAVTGIAGPGGAVPGKPVGLVYIAAAIKNKRPVCRECYFAGTRSNIKRYAAASALNFLRQELSRD